MTDSKPRDGSTPISFDAWIDSLNEDVVQDEYGYEPGEFTVYPEEWRPFFDEGLTPSAAFRRALDAFADDRRRQDLEQEENYRRSKAADAAFIAAN